MRLYKIFWLLLLIPLAWACEKITHGYLSDDVFYQVNPFYVQQGITTTSSSLVSNGSTEPLNVKLLSVTDVSTGASADSMFLKTQLIKIFTGTPTQDDSTLAMLNAKLEDSMVAPFSVNPIGGRLQFTGADLYVDTGTYSMDIQISNVRGSRVVKDACQLVVTPIATKDTLTYQSWTTGPTATGPFTPVAGQIPVTVTYVPGGADKIIFVWKDKNGNNFNPSAGEVNARVARPTFHNWDPYYPETRTDTSIEYQYPDGVPYLPAFSTVSTGGLSFGGGICYYQLAAAHTDIGLYVNTVSSIQYYLTKGTYVVTYLVNIVARVP
ncbi:hypothetical protein [Dinghuibacter silviterrae]|uniref:Uncharacterized protein n=1 Tax=Dinghuibacter silviterrae TaxID=1539049 RepID=A0A4R8DER2_9BACT|nr:hypothetical protein [Dinghuibacter silviterrae]TDW96053.1 hypothetical protein EDB95_3875 [Dinghuibacter silviterrae]